MKLFVWEKPYPVDYGMSMVFAVAKNIEEARRIATGDMAKRYSFGMLDGDGAHLRELGEPDRVVDIPCAEWHMWSE